MARKKSKPFRIESRQKQDAISIPEEAIQQKKGDKKVGVNLKYFDKNYECFSKWTKEELKKFSNFVKKCSEKTEVQITSVTKTCHVHRNCYKKPPATVSQDVMMYSLDVGGKTRVHGFFTGSDLFIVWLDREHQILKS